MQTEQEVLDQWYEEKKQALYEEYLKRLELKDVKAEEKYRVGMKKLKEKFTKKAEKLIDQERKNIGKKKSILIEKTANYWEKLVSMFNEKWT